MGEIRYKGKIFSGAAAYGGADDVSYDNTQSHLTATNVQDALDEVVTRALPKLVSSNRFSVTSQTTFAVPSNYRGMFMVIDSNATQCGAYILYSTSAGAVSYRAVAEASNLTITGGTNRLTITPSSGGRVMLVVNADGKITVS